MTTPGGVPNLPQGALTIDTLGSKTQDMSTAAMKSRAAERISPIFGGSTGSDPMSAITPFGFLTGLFAGFQSTVANADPNDINGPEDLPDLLLDFIQSLPVVGEFVRLLDAIKGTYEGDDETLQAVQAFFVSLREDVEQAQADADAAADKWAQSIDELLGAGHDVADFIDLLQGLRDGKVTALAPPNSNRLDNPSFDGLVSIDDPSNDFVWDHTVYRTASANPDLSGSAKAIADGTEKELRSNQVGVAEGQIWTFVANLASVGLTGTGQLVQLTVLPYDAAGNELPPVVLAGTGAPTAAVAWAMPPTGTVKGGQLLSDWTIPAGVARVRLRMVLTANATAGSINLDDMNLSAKSLIPQYWVQDLTAALTGFTTWLTQIGQITNGQIVTAYNASVQQFKDWWNGTLGPAAQAQNAATLSARQQRKAQNDDILRDGWHTTYPVGSITDTAATLVGGKRTWWGAFNDNLLLTAQMLGLAPVPATIDADVGTATQLAAATASTAAAAASLAQATNQDLTNKIIASQTGVEPTAGTAADAQNALQNIPASNIQGQTGAQVLWGATGGGNAGPNSTSWSHTPGPDDTSLDILIFYTHSSASTVAPSVTVSGGLTATKVNGYEATYVGQGYIAAEVWRVSLTPTASPTSKTITVAPNASSGTPYISGNSVSYSGIKVNYSNTYTGGLSAGTNAISMSRTSAADKRLVMAVGLTSSGAVSSWGGASGVTQRSTRTAVNTGPAYFIGDTQGTGATNQAMSVNCVLPSGVVGNYVGLLIEMSN